MQIGDQGERAAALGGTRGKDDRSGLGDRERAAREDSVEPVEFGGGELGVLDELDCVGAPFLRDSRGHADAGSAASGECRGDRAGECGPRGALNLCAVIPDSLAEQVDSRRAFAIAALAVGARDGCRDHGLSARAADAGEDQLT